MINNFCINTSKLAAAITFIVMPLVVSANEFDGAGQLSVPSSYMENLQLAAGPNAAGPNSTSSLSTSSKVTTTVKEIKDKPLEFKRYSDVQLNVSAPTSARVDKPFIVIFRFQSPVQGFSKDRVSVSKGKITYFAGNSYSTTYHALVVADPGLDKSLSNRVDVNVSNTATGQLQKSVKILPAVTAKASLAAISVVQLEPHGYFNLLVSRGGDSVDVSHSYDIGDTLGAQIGYSYPVPDFGQVASLHGLIPRGSVRAVLGYEEMSGGSRGAGDRTTFKTITGDLLYDVRFSEHWNLLAGLTIGHDGVLKAQKLSLRDLPGEREGEVGFETSYGFKFIAEYYPLKSGSVDLFIDIGFAVIDYIPSTVILNDNSTGLSSPTRVGASAVKLGFGLRI